jgi:hypothetical protein
MVAITIFYLNNARPHHGYGVRMYIHAPYLGLGNESPILKFDSRSKIDVPFTVLHLNMSPIYVLHTLTCASFMTIFIKNPLI